MEDGTTLTMPEQDTSWIMQHGSNYTSNDTLGAGQHDVDHTYPNTFKIFLMCVLPILMVLLNVLVFVVTPRMESKQLCMAKIGYAMLSLAATDVGLGMLYIVQISYMIHIDFMMTEEDPMCPILSYVKVVFIYVSILTLTFMSIDRLVVMAAPMRYPRYFTPRRLKIVHVSIWVFVVVFLTGTVCTGSGKIEYYKYMFGCAPDWSDSAALWASVMTLVMFWVIPTLVILACFVGVFIIARRGRAARMPKADCRVHQGTVSQNAGGGLQWTKDLRIFRSLVIMTSGYYITWTPYVICVLIPRMVTGESLSPDAEFYASWVTPYNSIWNIFIYMLTMRPFYRAMVGMFRDLLPKTDSGLNSDSHLMGQRHEQVTVNTIL